MTTDNKGSVSNGGADDKQRKDEGEGEGKEVDAENKPEESDTPETSSNKSSACKII